MSYHNAPFTARYGLTKKYFRCPSCGRLRFHRYERKLDGVLFPPEYGRCERVNNCGYILTPKGEELKQWEQGNDKQDTATPPQPPPALPVDSIIERYKGRHSDNLFKFLCKYYTPSMVVEVCDKYGCFTSANGRTMFVYQDRQHAYTAKSMLYNEDGHRNRDDRPRWLHKRLQITNTAPYNTPETKDHQPQKPPFGVHLLAQETETMFIVESEKTAIIAALEYHHRPHWLFVAVGGAANVAKIDELRNLCREFYKGCKIVLLPDNDKAGEKWQDYGKKHSISTLCEGGKEGADIADFILSKRQPTPPKPHEETPPPPAPGEEENTPYLFPFEVERVGRFGLPF